MENSSSWWHPREATSLSDLNDDPSLVSTLSDDDVKRLHNEAELGEVALAGGVRAALNGLFNDLSVPDED